MNKNLSSTFTSSSTDAVERGKHSFWQWLVEPVATITEAGERRQASLVSALLFVFVIAASIGPFAETYVLNDPTSARILIGMDIGFGVAYIFSRTKGYRLAVPILTVALAAWPILSVALAKDYSSTGLLTIFIFDVLIIIISSTLASFSTTVFLSLANSMGILLLPILIPAVQFGDITIPLIFNVLVSALVLVLTQHRNQVEKDRLSEGDKVNKALQTSNTALQTSNATLDIRTRGLNVAIEVGRSLSQVRALDVTLKDAAELIRSRFDLYYVQIYLTNPANNLLLLQAGTGTVGAELVGQGHHLTLDNTSINGRAAVEKNSVVISDTSVNDTSSLYFFSRSRQIKKKDISDSSSSGIFRPNPLLPDTLSEIAIPLILDEKVVGVLDLQNNKINSLNQDTLPAFETLAGQLAIAIQNANFLAETQRARAELEAQARHLTHTNWVDYLDAVHQPEEIGFVYQQNQIAPLKRDEQAKDDALIAPISITGESLGNLVVEMEGQSPIARVDELINTVARQVAQQIENLRLLDNAERYRAETEQASRRQTLEGWKDYAEANIAKGLSYIYDLKEVRPLNPDKDSQADASALSLPLKVRDETVGKLVVQGVEKDDNETRDLVTAVAERLGAHIENLRLSEQSLGRARREQALSQITSAVRGSTDPATILRSAARELGTLLGRKTIIRLATEKTSQMEHSADLVGEAAANNENESVSPAELPNADGGNK